MSTASSTYAPPVFSTPVHWILRVLSWLAFGVSAYLAWHAVNQSSVFGCGIGGSNGCDEVLTSSWSKWFGVPVAVMGLACYAMLAGLSVPLGLRSPGVSRWVNTAFLMLAMLAAGASAWFIGLQVFVIGRYCVFCMAVDFCGIAMGAIALGSAIRWFIETRYLRHRTATTGVMALRTTLPGGPRATAAGSTSTAKLPTPSMALAIVGAFALLIALTVGQVLNPSKTHTLEKATLERSIALAGADGESATPSGNQAGSGPHVAMRIPSEDGGREEPPVENGDRSNASNAGVESIPGVYTRPASESADAENNDSTKSEESSHGEATSDIASKSEGTSSPTPKRPERLVKFLDGKLTLDVYKHPLIGSPEAPHVIVEMISYDCAHCRKMHRTVERGLARYGKQLAVIVMPIPLEKGCNKFVTSSAGSHRGACVAARLSIGVATIRPSAFPRFHDWLMGGDVEKARPIEKVLLKAYDIADRSRLRSFIRGEEVNKQIAEYVDLFGRLQSSQPGGKLGLPVQILGDHVLSGSVEKEEEVYDAWEEHLGLELK